MRNNIKIVFSLYIGNRRTSDRDMNRMMGTDGSKTMSGNGSNQLPNSKSVPALHHVGGNIGKILYFFSCFSFSC